MKSVIDQLFIKVHEKENSASQLISKELLKSLEYKKEIPSMQALSQTCFVSQSTITKFAKSIGFSGYKELIIKFQIELDDRNHKKFSIDSNKKINNLFLQIEEQFVSTIKGFRKYEQKIKQCVIDISKSQRIFIFSSYSLNSEAGSLNEFLISRGFNVFWTPNIIYSLVNRKRISENDYVIFLIAGQDTKNIEYIYKQVQQNAAIKKILFISHSKRDLYKESENLIVLDNAFLPHDPAIRKILFSYLLLQVIQLLNNGHL